MQEQKCKECSSALTSPANTSISNVSSYSSVTNFSNDLTEQKFQIQVTRYSFWLQVTFLKSPPPHDNTSCLLMSAALSCSLLNWGKFTLQLIRAEQLIEFIFCFDEGDRYGVTHSKGLQ